VSISVYSWFEKSTPKNTTANPHELTRMTSFKFVSISVYSWFEKIYTEKTTANPHELTRMTDLIRVY